VNIGERITKGSAHKKKALSEWVGAAYQTRRAFIAIVDSGNTSKIKSAGGYRGREEGLGNKSCAQTEARKMAVTKRYKGGGPSIGARMASSWETQLNKILGEGTEK